LIDQLVLDVVILDLPESGYAERRSRDRVPKLAQRINATLRRIAGDDRRIDGADRDSGNPIGMQIGLGQRLINASLIGAERAAALEQQRDLFEGRAPLRHGKPPVPAVLRRNKPTALAPLLASRRRRWMPPPPRSRSWSRAGQIANLPPRVTENLHA
jgi:hypothetical protein